MGLREKLLNEREKKAAEKYKDSAEAKYKAIVDAIAPQQPAAPQPAPQPAPQQPAPMPQGAAPGMKKGGFVAHKDHVKKHSAGFKHHDDHVKAMCGGGMAKGKK